MSRRDRGGGQGARVSEREGRREKRERERQTEGWGGAFAEAALREEDCFLTPHVFASSFLVLVSWFFVGPTFEALNIIELSIL